MPYKDKRKMNEYIKNRQKKLNELNLCRACGKPVVSGYVRCVNCLLKESLQAKRRWNPNAEGAEILREKNREERQKRDKLWAETNRCRNCGCPLREDETKVCFACKANEHSLVSIPRKKGVYHEVNNQNLSKLAQSISVR